jgi:hypothetical protein
MGYAKGVVREREKRGIDQVPAWIAALQGKGFRC